MPRQAHFAPATTVGADLGAALPLLAHPADSSTDPDPKHRTGFAPFDRWIDAWRGAHEMPGLYPEALDPKERMRALQDSALGSLRRAAILTREARTEWGSAFGALSTVTESLLAKPQIWQGPHEIVNVLRGTSERTGIVNKLIPETEEAEVLKTAVTLGVGVGRLSRCEIRGRTMRSLTAWDAEHLRYEWQPDVWRIATNRGEEWRDIEEGAWVLCLPYGGKFPWKRAPWKAITLCYTLARDAWFQGSRYAQSVHPVRVGKANESSNPKQRTSFIEYLKAARFDPWLLLRPGEEFDIKGTTGGDKMTEIFEQIDARCRREVITCIKGETVTTDGGKGFASDSTQAEISADKMAFYARAISRFETEILGWAAYDLAGVDPWSVGITRTFDTTTRASRLADIQALAEAGAALEKVTAGTKGIDHQPVLQDVLATFSALGWRIEPVPPRAGPEQAAFNGAQVTAAAAIVAAVAAGQTPRDAGIGQLKALFNLDEAQAQSMMGTAGAGFHPAAPAHEARQKYNPDQSRADDGKFGSGPGSSKGDSDKGTKEPKDPKPEPKPDKPDKAAKPPEPGKEPAADKPAAQEVKVDLAALASRLAPAISEADYDDHASKEVRESFRDVLRAHGVVPRDIGEGADYVQTVRDDSKALAGGEACYDWSGKIIVSSSVAEGTQHLSKELSANPDALHGLRSYEIEDKLAPYHAFLHEELHGASRATKEAYTGIGVGIEEAATEILARKMARELAGPFGPDGPLPLPRLKSDGVSYQNQLLAYDNYISGLLTATSAVAGHDGIHERVEQALLRTRQGKITDEKWRSGEEQVRAYVDSLALSKEAAAKLYATLTGPDSPLR